MPATVISTDIGAILAAMQSRLVASTGLQTARVLPIVELPPRVQGDQEILIRPTSRRFERGWWTGHGRVAPLVRQVVQVVIRTRLALDPINAATQWHTNATLGHWASDLKAAAALLGWTPTDANDNHLTIEPLAPTDDPAAERPIAPAGYGTSAFHVLASFMLNIDKATP